MGRHHVLKPHHLYHSTSSHSPSSFLQLKPSYSSPSAFLQNSSFSALSVGGRIPGFKISAAFLSSLHSNIFIEVDSAYGSPISTPADLHTYAEASPSPFASSMSSLSSTDSVPLDPLCSPEPVPKKSIVDGSEQIPVVGGDGVPTLSTLVAEDEDTRAEALHIIADSVAQQRDIASRSIIFHPTTLALVAVTIGVLNWIFYNGTRTDWVKILMTCTGTVMVVLGAVRLTCGSYVFEAESVGTWKWLDKGRSAEDEEGTGLRVLGKQDDVLVIKYGEEYIGAIIFRGVQPIASSSSVNGYKRTRRTPSSSKQSRMVIRGWTVKPKYRRKKIGSALLERAIQSARAKGWTADGVIFAEDHANHKRLLPELFNGALDDFAEIAQRTLDKQVQEAGLIQDKSRKRRELKRQEYRVQRQGFANDTNNDHDNDF